VRFESKHKTSSSVDSDETGDNGLKTSENKDMSTFQENETRNEQKAEPRIEYL
jgi:hypothetical protein